MKYLRAFVFFLATALMYLGLPLLGWGLDDLHGFYSLAPRTGYALSVAVFAAAVGVQAISGTEGIRGGKGEEAKWNRRESVVRVVLALRWSGVALGALGYGLVFWSGLALGRQYSAEVTIQKDHRLITTGPYRWIRHPRYLGVIALAIGLSLAFRSRIGLAVAAAAFGILLFRIHDEENLMRKEFGKEWETYCRTSSRLLPGIF
jgi:protein-S-isoprenylcysteine O-methyltransferase Ste14